jgi:hypothetical protein
MVLGTGAKMCPNAELRKQQRTAKSEREPIRQDLSKRSETSRVRFWSIGICEDLCGRDAGIRTRRRIRPVLSSSFPIGRAKVGRFGAYSGRKSATRRLQFLAFSRVFSAGVDFRGVLITQRSKVQTLPPQPGISHAGRKLSALSFLKAGIGFEPSIASTRRGFEPSTEARFGHVRVNVRPGYGRHEA